MTVPLPELLSATDFARRVGVSYRSIYNWIADGRLNAVRVSRNRFAIPASELESAKKARRRPGPRPRAASAA